MTLLVAYDLQLWRGDHHVLHALSFEIEAGQCLAVTGANGAGKTSLLRALAGLVPLEDGGVRWRGREVRQDRLSYHAELRFLGHENGLKGDLTARENLRYSIGLPVHVDATQIDAALEHSGIDAGEPRLLRQMSAGQRRRVALAHLSLAGGVLWILDEPTAHLDTRGQQWVESLLAGHLAGGGVAVVATHQALNIGAVCTLELA